MGTVVHAADARPDRHRPAGGAGLTARVLERRSAGTWSPDVGEAISTLGIPITIDGLELVVFAPDDLPLRGYSALTGTAACRDVGRGRHLVAAFLGSRRLIAHAVVEMADEPVEVALPMKDPREGPHVLVRVLAHDGAPVREHVNFSAFAGQRYVRTDVFPLAAGGWVLAFAERDHELPGAGRIRASTGEYGSAEAAHDLRAPGPVTIRFAEPVRLRLRVEGYDGSGFEGRVMAVLAEEGDQFQAALDADGVDR